MSAIGKAIGPLVNIALLLLFAIIIFAIIGLEFYAGALNSTCYSLEDLGENFILYNCRNWRGFATAGHFDRYGFESQRNSVLPGNIINCDIARALFHNHINIVDYFLYSENNILFYVIINFNLFLQFILIFAR